MKSILKSILITIMVMILALDSVFIIHAIIQKQSPHEFGPTAMLMIMIVVLAWLVHETTFGD